MNFKLTSINIGASILVSWILFEYLMERKYKKKLKEHLRNVIFLSKEGYYKEYYTIDLRDIDCELENMNPLEKSHILVSYKTTFQYRSDSNLQSYMNKLYLYDEMRNENNNELLFQNNQIGHNYLMAIDNMIWYPYIFRILFSIQNLSDLAYFNKLYYLVIDKFSKNPCYRILPKDKNFEKSIIIFIGLGGFLYPFKDVFDLLIKNKYQIIIPIYGASQASLNYNIECHEAEFQDHLYQYLCKLNIKEVEILCWSLGGMLYKGFERHLELILKKNPFDQDEIIKIKKVFALEPLIGTRGCSDTFFSQIRTFQNTLDLMNQVTSKKYHNYNYIFSYFLHTVVGYSTCASFGYFNSVELIRPENRVKYQYPRHLFISTDDIVINDKLDKSLIDTNFSKDHTYYRNGYHGGWLLSNKIIFILEKIIKSN